MKSFLGALLLIEAVLLGVSAVSMVAGLVMMGSLLAPMGAAISVGALHPQRTGGQPQAASVAASDMKADTL